MVELLISLPDHFILNNNWHKHCHNQTGPPCSVLIFPGRIRNAHQFTAHTSSSHATTTDGFGRAALSHHHGLLGWWEASHRPVRVESDGQDFLIFHLRCQNKENKTTVHGNFGGRFYEVDFLEPQVPNILTESNCRAFQR